MTTSGCSRWRHSGDDLLDVAVHLMFRSGNLMLEVARLTACSVAVSYDTTREAAGAIEER